MRRSTLVVGLAILAAILAGSVAWYLTPMPNPDGQAFTVSKSNAPPVSVGGPFELTAHTGEAVTDKSFGDKYLLIFFGYTFCPDVCPTTLNDVAVALDSIGMRADLVQPLFITVDPARDTPEVLADYVTAFYPSILGLTGTPEQIAQVAKAYRAYYAKADPKTEDTEFYLMDHSVMLYLMSPEGQLLTLFSHTASPEDIAKGLMKYLPQPTS